MKVRELKQAIAKLDDDADVEIPIRVFTRAYPVAYLKPFEAQAMVGTEGGTLRIYVSFPEGYSVAKRKDAKET